MRSNNERLNRASNRSKHAKTKSKVNVEELSKSSKKMAGKERKNKPKVMTESRKRFIRKCNNLFIIIYIIFSIYRIVSYFSWKSLALPMMKNQCSTVVDINGNLVDTIGGERIKENVALSDVPQDLIDAYVDIEDERFFSHKGVDIKRTTAAIGSYILHGGKSSFGGSTITQQLVKNMTGNDDTSISRKIGEWVKAVELESFTTKEEILEAYLNIIYTAPNVYGVNMGAKYYFNKDVKDLSLAECAYIAGINISPNSYNPFGENDNSERIKNRSKTVLDKMLEVGDITQDEYNRAVEEINNGLAFNKGDVSAQNDGVYSYYTDAVISEVVPEIAEKKHISEKFATNYIYMAGLTIHSGEDISVQEKIENEYNNNNYILTSSSGQKSQSAMVIIDHSTGQVRGIVGGLGTKTTSRGLNRATQSYRQTGSAIKPIAVLAPGIDKKLFTASTVYNDEPTTFADDYSPKDNDAYLGNITVRRAVESSQNIPFVKMMEQVTPEVSIKYLKKMGISSLTEKDQTLSLALGGEERGITPLEMAAAYATIANDGVYIEPTFYIDVVDNSGKTVIKTKQKKNKVFSKEVAYILKELLKQPVEGSNGTARSCKIDGMDVAAKTGTTNENYDKWLCGFTTYYTAVTWYGYDINESISYGGRSPAIQLWSTVMKNVHSGLNKTTFEKPSAIKEATVCSKTGNLTNSKCNPTHTEYFLAGTLPTKCIECTGYTQNRVYNNNTSTTTQTQTTDNNEQNDEQDDVNTEQETTEVPDVEVTNVPNNTEVNNTTNNLTNDTTSNTEETITSDIPDNQDSSESSDNTQTIDDEDTSPGGLVDDGEPDNGP